MKRKNKVTEPEVELVVEPEVEPEIELEVQPEVEPAIELEVEAEKQEEVQPEETVKTIIDNVMLYNCKKLNVRKEPNKESEIVCVINEDSEFTICLEESTNEFFKVYTVSNEILCEGYCLKEYIYIK